MESAGLGAAGKRMTYGNQAGRSILEMMVINQTQTRELQDRMTNKDAQIEGLEERMANKDTRIERLEEWMANKDTRIEGLENRMANKDIQIANHQAEIATLLDRVSILTTDAEGYHDIRHRFIDVFRRDVLKDINEAGFKRIGAGNATAHEGDAITDARLYTTGQRDDMHALIHLYGLNANEISLLSKCPTF